MAMNGATNGSLQARKGDERTPLLRKESSEAVKYGKSVLYRALLCGFMVSLSFGVTQVPLIYVFRLMTCDAYYKTHSDPTGPLDHCSIPQIEADTARAIALLGASTTLFGVLNLFVTGRLIKKYGPKVALLISVFWPAVRLAIQNIGVMTGSYQGILIIQSSQIITILGGPAGYLLALNSYVIEVIEPSERTGALGKLQGCTFFGTSLAYLVGGVVSDTFGILAPFRVTLGLFLTSCIYVLVFLPWIPPQKYVPSQTSSGLKRFFGPLKALAPQRWLLQSGKIQTEYGPMLLASGTFLAVLATGYQSTLLQMYATDVWSFLPTENGYLISLNTFDRGLFLTMAFPRIISFGRKHLSSKQTLEQTENGVSSDSAIPDFPQQPNDFADLAAMDEEEEPVEPAKLRNKTETFEFDLFYSRYSLLADGIITGAASFISQGWQLYLFAVLLPLAAGTGSAAKGSILQMCPAAERTDALSAITLVDMLARLSTISVFGLVFAAFASIGKTYLVFTCNAAVALVGFCVLMFSRFPPEGSKRVEEEVHEPLPN